MTTAMEKLKEALIKRGVRHDELMIEALCELEDRLEVLEARNFLINGEVPRVGADRLKKVSWLWDAYRTVQKVIADVCPAGRESSLAQTNLEQCYMWAQRAIFKFKDDPVNAATDSGDGKG